jgi:hypothetical protein
VKALIATSPIHFLNIFSKKNAAIKSACKFL